jgi:hypothetical protein
MSTTATLPAVFLSDPGWMAMDIVVRALHLQLLCVAANRRPAGTLPDDDAMWRKWCSIPVTTSRAIKRRAPISPELAMAMLCDPVALSRVRTEGPHLLTQQLWEEVWKPQITKEWTLIDDALIAERPTLSRARGGRWSAVAEAMAGAGFGAEVKTAAATAKKKGKAKNVLLNKEKTEAHDGIYDSGNIESIEKTLDLDLVWTDPRRVKAAWRATLPKPSQESLWDLGIKALEPVAGQKAARQQLIGLINKYGEVQVSQAIGILLGRGTRPADPIAFVVRTLKNQTEGPVSVQRARAQRARVAL